MPTSYAFLEALNGTLTDPVALAGEMSGNLRDATRVAFDTRNELAGAVLPYGTAEVRVTRYASSGPPVDMLYSINNSSQSSTDPTSMAVTVMQPDGTTTTKYTKLTNERVTPCMMGAPIDGITDDAPSIQNCLTKFGNCYPDAVGPAWINYIIKSPILPVANSVWDFTGWKGLMKVDLSIFTNATLAGQYGNTGAVIQVTGTKTGTDIPIDGVVIRGLRITPIAFVEQRFTSAISLINASNFFVESNEIYGFCAGVGINLNSCTNGKIRYNHIHDWYTNYAWAIVQPITTAVAADSDRVQSGKSSTWLTITNNRVVSLTEGAVAIAAIGYQTEGIDVSAANVDCYHTIADNEITLVDESIASFSNHVTITGNRINMVQSGVKLDHGACHCLVDGNMMDNVKLWGVSITTHNDFAMTGNRVTSNHITMLGGSPVNANQAPIYVADSNTYPLTDTVLSGNVFNTKGLTPYNVYSELNSGIVRSVNDQWVQAGSDATYPWAKETVAGKFLFERPVKKTRFKASLAANFTKDGTANEEFLTFSSISVDERSEYVASTTNAPVVQMQGYYTFTLQFASTSWPTANAATISLYSFDGSTLRRLRGYFNPANSSGSPCFVAKHVYLPKANTKITVGIGFASGSTATIIAGVIDTFLEIEKE